MCAVFTVAVIEQDASTVTEAVEVEVVLGAAFTLDLESSTPETIVAPTNPPTIKRLFIFLISFFL